MTGKSEAVGTEKAGRAPLSGRIAIITGASAGIGRATAIRLAHDGAAVVINARRRERLEEVARAIESEGGGACVVPGDAGDPAVIGAMFDAACECFGRGADLVVVNAGRGLKGSPLTSDTSEWEEVFRTNIHAAALLIREAATRMVAMGPNPPAPSGSSDLSGAERDAWLSRPRDVIVISSSVGKNISPFSSMYGASKFAITSIAEAVRREVAPNGVRVVCIHPAVVLSEFQQVAGYDPVGFGAFMDRIGPVLDPEDIADVIAYAAALPARACLNDVMIRPTRQEYP